MSYRDIKRIANRFTKVYDPNKNNNGILVEENQITVPGAQDDVFNNRYRVLAKMNRYKEDIIHQVEIIIIIDFMMSEVLIDMIEKGHIMEKFESRLIDIL